MSKNEIGFATNASMALRPDHLPPSAWTGHIPFGMWLVEALRPRLLVELGTHHGASYLGFCQAMQANGVDGRCLAVDTWAGDEHAGAYGNEVYDTLSRHHDPRYSSFSELLRMTFDDALDCVADGTVDLLHIDGLHTYDAVKHDFDTWMPKLSDRAVVLFHDIEVRERGFGVWRFWDEVRARHPAFAFLHSHGLGVLLVGANVPSAVRALATLQDAERKQVQALFERLGEGLQQRSRAEELERVAAGHEEGLVAYRTHAQALEQRLGEVQGELVGFQDELRALRPRATAMEHEIAGLRNEVASRQHGLDEYRDHARALETHVADLDAQLRQLRGDLHAAAAERERMQQTFVHATDQYAQSLNDLARRLDDSTRRLDDAHTQSQSLATELQRVLQSRSWRMTAWMRRLASAVRGR